MKTESLVELKGGHYLPNNLRSKAYLMYGRWLIHQHVEYEYDDMAYLRPRETLPLVKVVDKGDGEYDYIYPTREDLDRSYEQWNLWRLYEIGGRYCGSYDSLEEAVEKVEREESVYVDEEFVTKWSKETP